jgi:hypothetical protein
MANLVMGVFWLVVGCLLLIWQRLHPEDRALTIFDTDVSVGWIVLVFALYKLVRWWSRRSLAADRDFLAWMHQRRRTPEEPRPARPPGSRDPNFDFTDEGSAGP